MTTPETELLTALYLLYSSECVHWLKPNETAFTRSSSTGWKQHRTGPLSLTLLGRMPVLADPFLFRPGFIHRRSAEESRPQIEIRALHKTALRLNALRLTRWQCRLQAIILLVDIPVVIWTDHLASLWPRLLVMLLTSHVLLIFSLWRDLRRYKPHGAFSVIAPMLLNPLGALRIMDILSQAIFEREMVRRSARKALPEQANVH